jgi:hypothetical protein
MAGHSKMAGLSNLIDYGRITGNTDITRLWGYFRVADDRSRNPSCTLVSDA